MSVYQDSPVLSKILEAPRYACSLAGALQTILAIDRGIPILHSAPGCGYNLYLGYDVMGGHQGTGYAGGTNVPCSRLGEKEVILGGEEKLGKIIKGTMEVMDADFFTVLTGCAADLIGDDLKGVIKKVKGAKVPITYVETGGFKGNTYRGYERVVEAFADQLMEKPGRVEKGLVNVFGIIPSQDVFWKGNLKSLQHILERLGLKANMLLGHHEFGLEAWRRVPSAELNIVVSPWVGVTPAQKLEAKFGTPYTVLPGIPIGPTETSRLVRQVAERLNIDRNFVDRVIAEEERLYYYYLESLADTYQDYNMQLDFIVIGDSHYVVGITRFLTNDMGCIPFSAVITDDPPDKYRTTILDELGKLNFGLKPEVIFESNSGKIWEMLSGTEANLVLGSFLDKPFSHSIGAAHLSVSFPIADRVIVDNSYAGYSGGLHLTSDIYTAVMQTKSQ